MDPEIRLIRNIQRRRSRKAADLLVRNYYREIYVYVFRQLGNKEDAMDLTQDIFIAVLQSIDRFDSAKSTFRTWLYGIATHKVIDFRRKEKPAWLSLERMATTDRPDLLLVFDRLSPLLAALPLIGFPVGYLTGPRSRAMVHGDISSNNKRVQRKKRKAIKARQARTQKKNEII